MDKLVPLADAYRMVLRKRYPQLANEIVSYNYFHHLPRDVATNKFTDEAVAATEALNTFHDAIEQGQLRFRGCLGDNPPAEIDPIDVTINGLHVFNGIIEVYRHGKTVRTYYNVHCYADDIRALLKQKRKGGRKPKFDQATIATAVKRLMDHHGPFSEDDPEWNAEVRLIEALRKEFGEAAKSTWEDYIKAPLAEWREQKASRPET